MVAQNTFSTFEGKQVIIENDFKFVAAAEENASTNRITDFSLHVRTYFQVTI